MASESGKIDPMHQFEVQSIYEGFTLGGHQIAFTNSALWMIVATAVLILFMAGGMRRAVVPGRWQLMVESFTGFIENLVDANIGEGGRKYAPYIFSLFMFILFANVLGLLPVGVFGLHPFTTTSHFTVTGLLAIMSFSIVLIVGFFKHGIKFFSLFVPHGTPLIMIPLMFVVELMSFLVRPFSLALRLFVAMTAGHILLKVLGSFVITGASAGATYGAIVSLPSFILMIGISALELLVAGIQAYVFALLTALYINDAEHLH